MRHAWVPVMCALLLAAGCSKQVEMASGFAGAAAPVAAEASMAADADASDGRAYLAYEHEAGVNLPAADIPARLRAVQAACNDARFGTCVVLAVRQQGGDWPSATLSVRVVPAGVEPLIALASAGAEPGHRSSRAEDLAVVVRDNTLAQARLHKERERLLAFQARPDLAVADMIALSKQLAETESQLEQAQQTGAQHQRRIDTQLLTLEFQPTALQANRNEVWRALRDSGQTLSAGLAWTIRAALFLLPLLAVLATLVLAVRRWRQRRLR